MTDDLISREAALKALRSSNVTVKGMQVGKTILVEYTHQLRDGYAEAIRKIPAASTDFESHGEWLYAGESKSGDSVWRCSHCKKERTGRQARSVYCRDCGCHMDLTRIIPGQISIDI